MNKRGQFYNDGIKNDRIWTARISLKHKSENPFSPRFMYQETRFY